MLDSGGIFFFQVTTGIFHWYEVDVGMLKSLPLCFFDKREYSNERNQVHNCVLGTCWENPTQPLPAKFHMCVEVTNYQRSEGSTRHTYGNHFSSVSISQVSIMRINDLVVCYPAAQ